MTGKLDALKVAALKDRMGGAFEWMQDRWEDFRARSGFYQARVLLVVAYAVIVVGTLILAPPPTPSFAVAVESVDFGLSTRTRIKIQNLDLGDLENAVLEVHGVVTEFDGSTTRGVWKHTIKRFPELTDYDVQPEQLVDKRNRPAGYNLAVERVRLLKESGGVLFDWRPPPK